MDWKKTFQVKNVSGGKLVTGAISIPHGHERVLDPNRLPNEVLESLQKFAEMEKIEVSNDFEVADSKDKAVVIEKPTLKSSFVEANGKAITLGDAGAINEGSMFKVESNVDEISSAVQVDYTELDRIEAKEFLAQHWKRVETEVNKITSQRKLKFYLEVATAEAVADKKIEIIEDRLKNL